jgi:hypothetical protein
VLRLAVSQKALQRIPHFMLDSDVVASRRNDIYDQLKVCEWRLKCLLMGGESFQMVFSLWSLVFDLWSSDSFCALVPETEDQKPKPISQLTSN